MSPNVGFLLFCGTICAPVRLGREQGLQDCNCLHSCPRRCPTMYNDINGWVQYRNSCYLFREEYKLSNTIAGHDCFINRGDLVSIDDKEEDEFIRSFTQKLFKYPTNLNEVIWVNGNLTLHPGLSKPPEWRYCLAMIGDKNFTWDYVQCEQKHFYICEISDINKDNGN